MCFTLSELQLSSRNYLREYGELRKNSSQNGRGMRKISNCGVFLKGEDILHQAAGGFFA